MDKLRLSIEQVSSIKQTRIHNNARGRTQQHAVTHNAKPKPRLVAHSDSNKHQQKTPGPYLSDGQEEQQSNSKVCDEVRQKLGHVSGLTVVAEFDQSMNYCCSPLLFSIGR